MQQLGMTVEKKDLGNDPLYPGEDIKLPPVILASLGNDPTKKTVCKPQHTLFLRQWLRSMSLFPGSNYSLELNLFVSRIYSCVYFLCLIAKS